MMNQVYRKETCPHGFKAISLLKEKNISFQDNIFKSNDEIIQFKQHYSVETTPQVFLEGKRVGGFSDLAASFGIKVENKTINRSYFPVMALFGVSALLAVVLKAGLMGFMGITLSFLATLKLMDLKGFFQSFTKYDLISKKFPFYAFAYPFFELLSGVGFLAMKFPLLTGGISAFAGFFGGISVIKAVFIEKQDLNCACVGGSSKVPLGIISLLENVAMLLMGAYLITSL